MTNSIATITAATLIVVQVSAASAGLAAGPAADGTAPAYPAVAALAGPGDLGGAAPESAGSAEQDAILQLAGFGIRVPGLKSVGRAMSAVTGGSSSQQVETRRGPGLRQGGAVVRDHRTAPVTRDHRRDRTVVRAQRGRGAQEGARATLREDSRGTIEEAIRQSSGS